jgi:transketolase
LAKELQRAISGHLPENWKSVLPTYNPADTKAVATRVRSEEVINALAPIISELVGGSADLTPSNLTLMKCSGDFQKNTPQGRYISFGVREHAMAAICNGILAHGGLRPYCATFLNFVGYALGAIRLSALSHFGIIYVMTHDSIGLGEDGPTHQPIEMLETLRTIPNLLTLRPADGNETSGSYMVALERAHTPSVLCLSRQGTPTLEGSKMESVAFGAYVLNDFKHNADHLPYPTLTIMSSGTEVALAVKVAQQFMADGGDHCWIRVVSAPCHELFNKQTSDYQRSVLMYGSPVMSIEASCITGSWKKYAHAVYGIPDCFGFSAPADQIYKYFGFEISNLMKCARDVIQFYKEHDNQKATNGVANHPFAVSLLDCPQFRFNVVQH